ncbi:MAG: RsmG family class I SAM-dependent methyltransferase [Acidimicrobiales bacterium]
MPVPPRRALDLGSGGGVPGLVLARSWPASCWVLLDAGERRAAFLRSAISELDLRDRVAVLEERAETAGRDPALRASFDLVVARSFGLPAVTAECAAGFLAVGGHLVVSEPPANAEGRWDVAGLARLGLEPVAPSAAADFRVQVFEQTQACPDRYPRRSGVPAKRPLWSSVSRETSGRMLDPNQGQRGGSRQ